MNFIIRRWREIAVVSGTIFARIGAGYLGKWNDDVSFLIGVGMAYAMYWAIVIHGDGPKSRKAQAPDLTVLLPPDVSDRMAEIGASARMGMLATVTGMMSVGNSVSIKCEWMDGSRNNTRIYFHKGELETESILAGFAAWAADLAVIHGEDAGREQ